MDDTLKMLCAVLVAVVICKLLKTEGLLTYDGRDVASKCPPGYISTPDKCIRGTKHRGPGFNFTRKRRCEKVHGRCEKHSGQRLYYPICGKAHGYEDYPDRMGCCLCAAARTSDTICRDRICYIKK